MGPALGAIVALTGLGESPVDWEAGSRRAAEVITLVFH
jgi:hypothetical protein